MHSVKLKKRRLDATKSRWSVSQKMEAVTTFLVLGGNIAHTAAALRIPVDTVYRWKRTDWWRESLIEIRGQENLTLSAKLKRLVDNSLEAVQDRLEHGDWIYDQKSGEMRRKPVAMKDAHKVAVDLIDKKVKLEKQENFVVAQENIQDKLNKLAQAFSELANKPKPQINVTDVVFATEETNDALHEERSEDGEVSEGLSTRESPLQLKAGTAEEPLRTHYYETTI